MSLWTEHFHWSVWLRWEVLGWTIAALLAVGGIVLIFDQFGLVNVCFMLVATLMLAKVTHVAITSASDPAWQRVLFTFLLFGAIGVGIVEVVRGVNAYSEKKVRAEVEHRPELIQPKEPKQDSPRTQNTGNMQAPERTDIAWSFDTEEGRFTFLGMQTVPGPVSEPLILGFQAHGKNNLDDPILHFSGFVRSDITNETFPIFLARDNKLLRPEDTLGIPRKAEFDLSAKPFPSNHPEGYLGAGMNASTFLRQYPELTFVFEYDGKRYVKHFTKRDVWTAVENFRRQSLGYDKP